MRTSIYIPDELWKQAEEHKKSINISSIVQDALDRYLKRLSTISIEQVSNEELEATIERLNREKDELKKYSYTEGVKAGREWALNEASYEELSTYNEDDNPPEEIDKWIDERCREGEVIDYDAFSEGWFKGVEEIWLAVKDKI